MCELNGEQHVYPVGNTPNAGEREIKRQVGPLISNCKSRWRLHQLPVPTTGVLDEDDISRCILFFKNHPPIVKYFSRTTHVQRFIDQSDTP
jgi:hypothetical protein